MESSLAKTLGKARAIMVENLHNKVSLFFCVRVKFIAMYSSAADLWTHDPRFMSLNPLRQCVSMSWAIGRGVNREGFNFKLAMVKTCSTWPLLNKYALQKILNLVFRPHHHLRPPTCIAYEKDQKLKIWILFLPWSKCIHSNLKGIIITFKQKLDVIYRPHGCVLSLKWLFLVKNGIISSHLAAVGYVKPFKFSIKCL